MIGFFKGLSANSIMYFLAACVIVFGLWQGYGFVNDKIEADKKIVTLEMEVQTNEETIRILNEAAAQKDRAIEAADAANSELDALNPQYDDIRRNADNVKDEDDATLAPVLRRTLDTLDGL